MDTYSRIENGQETGDIRFGAHPKDGDWRKVVVEGLGYDNKTHREVRRETRIYSDRVARVIVTEPIPKVIPESVTPYQARMALLGAGLLDDVDALMINDATSRAAKIAWEYATVIHRHSPLIDALAPALGLSDAQLDALFVAAAQIV